MSGIARTYRGADGARGPLLSVRGARRAALSEWARVEGPDGRRRGQVIEVGPDTVIQLFEDTVGLSPARSSVVLTGDIARAVVGTELFGRVLSGAGAPLDGLPPPVGSARAPVWAPPINPVRRRSRTTSSRPGSPPLTA